MGRRKAGTSEAFFKVKYLKRSRQLYRRYLEAKPWVRQLYREFLQLAPGMRDASLKAAEAETRKAQLSGMISYRKGDAYSIPVENSYASLACCRTLLIHLQDPLRALKEMVRVTKTGQMVAAVEPGEMFSLVDPDDEEFTELAREINRAYYRGVKRLEEKQYEWATGFPAYSARPVSRKSGPRSRRMSGPPLTRGPASPL